MQNEWEINGRPMSEVIAELEELKKVGGSRVLSLDWLPGEYWGKANEVATRDSIRTFANAVGDANPLWTNPEYARKTTFGCIVAPPLYLNCIAAGWGAGASLFRQVENAWIKIRSGGSSVNAGSRWERVGEVREGDSFTVHDCFRDFELKNSRTSGGAPMLLRTTDRTYVNQQGQVAATCSIRSIQVAARPGDATPGLPSSAANVSKPYKYTDQELEGIERAYAAEERRGGTKRYWEGVVEGDTLKPVVKGPVITDDAVAFIGATGLMQRAYGLRLLARDKTENLKNSEDNTPAGIQTMHVYDGPLHGRTDPRAMPIIAGAQTETWIAHCVTNWIGDDGFLKILDNQHRHVYRFRDTYWCYGSVTRKYIQDGEHLVDLLLWTQNQEGVKHTTSKATVRLPSASNL